MVLESEARFYKIQSLFYETALWFYETAMRIRLYKRRELEIYQGDVFPFRISSPFFIYLL